MSNTPETDKQWAGWLHKLKMPIESFIDFARKLERERDEAREAFAIATNSVDAQQRLREMERELNEARKALREIASLDTSQDASPQQCGAVLVAMNALGL